jgi:transposase-like protein
MTGGATWWWAEDPGCKRCGDAQRRSALAVDETYVKVAGHWRYVYRAVDQFGQVIDVFVSSNGH